MLPWECSCSYSLLSLQVVQVLTSHGLVPAADKLSLIKRCIFIMQPVGLLPLTICLKECGYPLSIGQTQPGITIGVASELQAFLNMNTENNHEVTHFPCKQPMCSLRMRCSLHFREAFNPVSTVIKHFCCQKGWVYPHPLQQHFPTPFPTASFDVTMRAANSGQRALQCTVSLQNSLKWYITELNIKQSQYK